MLEASFLFYNDDAEKARLVAGNVKLSKFMSAVFW